MPRVIAVLALVLIGMVAPIAQAEPPTMTLVLVAPPPPLLDAVATSLDPWQVRVVVAPAGAAPAADLAQHHDAGFVATVRAGTLELFERGGATQARSIPIAIDDVEAASIALTIKTWMRLGPAPTTPAPPPTPVDDRRPIAPGAALARRWRVTALAGLGARANQGGFGAGPRAAMGAGASNDRLDATLVLDLGTDVAIASSADLMWSQLLLAGRVGRRFELRPNLWLRPLIGLSVIRARAHGVQLVTGRAVEKVSYSAGFEGAAEVGVTHTRWSATFALGLTAVPFTQELHGQIRLTVDARIEPWVQLGATAQFP